MAVPVVAFSPMFAALLPDDAERVLPDGQIERVALADLGEGDVALVRPGGRVPADGVVVDGSAAVDESMITGESRAVDRTVGDRVVAGTVATDSALQIRVDAVGEATALAGSAGSSSRRSPPGRAPRRWPTGRRERCSGSP